MRLVRFTLCVAILAGAGACARSHANADAWVVRFGPVLGNETIAGRVVFGRTAWILTGERALVRVQLDSREFTSAPVQPLAPGEQLWGLAAADIYGFWTLAGRSTLAQVSGDGEVRQRIPLAEPHSGVYTGRGELLYQVMNLTPPVPALLAGPPGDASRRPWGSMRTRELPLVRAQTALMNMVACGPTATGTIPCWFPDHNILTLTDVSGISRALTLEGFGTVSHDVLLKADRPRRPIVDAFVSAAGELWVLGSGDPPPGQTDRRGGWLLARYTLDGRQLQRTTLPEPARLLLGVTSDSAILLASSGMIVEARP